MNVLQIIYIPHKRNNRKTDFVHITTESGRDIKMTVAHIIPAGKCSDDPLPLSLPLAYAEKGKLSRKSIIISLSLFLSFLFCFFLSFLVSFFLSFFLFIFLFAFTTLDWCDLSKVPHQLSHSPASSPSLPLADWCFGSLTHSSITHTHLPTYLLIHSLTHSLFHSPTHLLTYTHSSTYSLTRSFILPLIYLLLTYMKYRQIKSVTFLNFDSDCRRLCDDNYGWWKSEEGRESSGRGSVHSSDERGAITNRVIYFISFTFRIHAVENWLIYCDFSFFLFSKEWR